MSTTPGDPRPECPKCGGVMEEGFLRDITHGATVQTTWIEGTPVASFWGGVKLRGLVQLPVTTLRCAGCGYLESYAHRPPESPEA